MQDHPGHRRNTRCADHLDLGFRPSAATTCGVDGNRRTMGGDLMGAITLLDGGMGQELINRGAPRSEELWSAWALLTL